ncbi:cytochrome P450 [Paenarthrobacter nitroguajacolicus]|uniref:cytochrome P450 n=1 Tax=Paenarthrobacter nitroguajacolicus TaxID=211146 RepID=UPI000AAD30BB|nr:cytochrome P450 [Paenarthrobacter nitroguajacolicus]
MRTLERTAPVADWVDVNELADDPYPSYERLRHEAPVAYVPQLNRYLVTRFQDCFDAEMDQETFSCHERAERSLMIRAMGRPLVRRDDPEHSTERSSFAAALRPKAIKTAWLHVFEQNASKHIERLREAGPGVDLFKDFAIPYAADNLSAVLGLHGVDAGTMMRWSHTLVEGTGNIADDEAVWARTRAVSEEIDAAIEESLRFANAGEVPSMLQAMVSSGSISNESISANVKLTIAGGMNEPSHVISCGVWALLSDNSQLQAVTAGDRNFADVFQEAARFVSPVGMYPRIVTKDTSLGGFSIPGGSTVGLVIASANRDDARFENASVFDVRREARTNLAFGNGTHVCAGNWVARAMVGAVAFPRLFEAFPTLRLADSDPVEFAGWIFRGTTALRVAW